MCFAAGPKNPSSGLVLWEGVERDVFVFPGFSGCWVCVVELILSLCAQFSPSSVSLVKCPAQWAERREEVTGWQMGWVCCLYPRSSSVALVELPFSGSQKLEKLLNFKKISFFVDEPYSSFRLSPPSLIVDFHGSKKMLREQGWALHCRGPDRGWHCRP